MNPWFLLFDGSSPDGRGDPDYIGRTTDKAKAKAHAKKCSENPYCTGYVVVCTDTQYRRADVWTNWGKEKA
jgi:hypothetical protein